MLLSDIWKNNLSSHAAESASLIPAGGLLLNVWTNMAYSVNASGSLFAIGGDLKANLDSPSFVGLVSFSKGADIASASVLPNAIDGNYCEVTGTTTITSIATTNRIGTVIKRRFTGILTLTHNATSLVLPGSANIVTEVGDEAEFIEYSAGNFRCTSYTRASGSSIVSAISMINNQTYFIGGF